MSTQQLNSPLPALEKLIRQADTHKGLYGCAAIIGGAPNMVGAALLAGRAALNLGTGKVYLGLLEKNFLVDPVQPELMFCSPSALLKNKIPSHILIGPGLGNTSNAEQLISKSLTSEIPLIIDADGLNLIAKSKILESFLQQRKADTIITPHPTEAARLLKCSTQEIQSNRQHSIHQLQKKYKCAIVLKGNNTLIQGNCTTIFQNQTGNSALSSAGQGDVLGGIILALWAQGMCTIDACCCGVYIHGEAADLWRVNYPNGIGFTASETINLSKQALNTHLQHIQSTY